MLKGWQGLADGALGCYACVLSFPPCGNDLLKALDSSFRWNDDRGEMGVCRYPDSPLRLSLTNHLALALAVIYGQEVLYAVKGQDARNRPA